MDCGVFGETIEREVSQVGRLLLALHLLSFSFFVGVLGPIKSLHKAPYTPTKIQLYYLWDSSVGCLPIVSY